DFYASRSSRQGPAKPKKHAKKRVKKRARRQTRAPETAPHVVRHRTLTMASPIKPSNASAPKNRKPAPKPPVAALAEPSACARKYPPTPPAQPTRPVIRPIS